MNPRRWRITNFNSTHRLFFHYVVVWVLGILLGVLIPFFTGMDKTVATLTAKLRPNFCLLYLLNVIPSVILLISLLIRQYFFVFTFLFSYGVLQAYCGMYVSLAVGSGGWLIRHLLLFSSNFVSVVIWLLVLSSFNLRYHCKKLFCCTVLFVSAVTFFDYFVVSPFLMDII